MILGGICRTCVYRYGEILRPGCVLHYSGYVRKCRYYRKDFRIGVNNENSKETKSETGKVSSEDF